MMAERKRTGESGSPLCCEVAWLKRRRALEDMPTTHVDARSGETSCPQSAPWCGCGELCELLEAQNRLLCDILGAVNSLTAAQLMANQKRA